MIAVRGCCAVQAKAAFAAAAASAEITNTGMGLKTSEILNRAKVMAPNAKPTCTAMVSQDPRARPECHNAVTWGSTAVPVNQSDIASNSARDNKSRTRREE